MNQNSLKKELLDKLQKVKQYLKEEKLFEYTDVVFSNYEDRHHLSESQIKKLELEVKNCSRCELSKFRINAVFGEGNIAAKVMFVGEGPGYEEDRQGRPFVGKAGQLLTKIIESIKLKREEVYITNVVKCHPMINPATPERHGNDRAPTEDEISSCLPYLIGQIEIINPKVIVTLGNIATQTLLRKFNSDFSDKEILGVTKLRGKFYQYKNIKLLPTYHPAALLRNPNLKKLVWQDMKLLKVELGI